jgi:phenylalanyl-tRNA synthetase beta chain
MPTITLEHETLNKIQKKNGVIHDYIKWENWLPKLGCPVENNDKEKIEIEVFPDRPDLLSHETMAKAVRSFLKLSKESPDLEILKGENKIIVDKDTINSRPIIMSAIVKGVDTGKDFDEREKFIQSLMDHQEKLHLTLGRKRKFASIGVHDLKMISAPFRYITVPSSFKFTPLGGEKDMSIEEIIFQHPKGI